MTAMNVAIVGAGLGGLGLALALNSHSISCSIYEQTPKEGRFAGAVMLSPNSLRILDHYGLYQRLSKQGLNFEYVDFQNVDGTSSDHQFLGSKEQFGYNALRIYRNALLAELTKACHDRGIAIHYGKKFKSITKETEENAAIEFVDGDAVTTDLLIAADGIHSKIRQSLFPGVMAKYNGILVVAGAVKKSKLSFPPNERADSPIMQVGQGGAFIMAPQNTDGSEWLAGTQRVYPEQDRAGWKTIAADKAFQHAYLEEGFEHRSELVKSAIKNIEEDSMYIWAQHTLPKLPSWTSEKSRVVIIGDAAHAIPPTTGQGANQAFEDGYTLAEILARRPSKGGLVEALAFWRSIREERVERLLDMTRRLNNMRLPLEERNKLGKDDLWASGGSGESLRWLFEPKLKEQIDEWVREKEGGI